MAEDYSYFNKGLEELLPLYSKVKGRIALAEKISDNVYLAAINELRNALDHLMRAPKRDKEGVTNELSECKEHLIRAAFDAFDLISMEILNRTEEKLKTFDVELIATVSNGIVFSEFIPKINDIIKTAATVKAGKYDDLFLEADLNPSEKFDKIFEKYDNLLTETILLEERIIALIPSLALAKNQKEAGKRADRFWDWKKAIIMAIMASALTFGCKYLYDNANKPNSNVESTQLNSGK